jgi:hypothetical protein
MLRSVAAWLNEPSDDGDGDEGVLTWTKGLRGGACGCTKGAIYTNTSEGPIDQASG